MKFSDVARGYQNLWNRATIRPEHRGDALAIARKLAANRARYEISSVPWWWVAITHQLESSGNFKTHLHNGDPLTARTKRVPAGRPKTGEPPFTWEASALDALQLKDLDDIPAADWTIPRALWEFERYNGLGYFGRGVNSPYLWSYTTLYSRGKYVADGRYDANAVSQQCGAAAILKAMIEIGHVVDIGGPVKQPDAVFDLTLPERPAPRPAEPESNVFVLLWKWIFG